MGILGSGPHLPSLGCGWEVVPGVQGAGLSPWGKGLRRGFSLRRKEGVEGWEPWGP